MTEPVAIDVGERFACALGAQCILTKAVERITAEQKKRARDLEKSIAAACKSLVNGGLELDWPDIPKQKQLAADLAAGFSVEQVQAMIAPLPPDVSLPYMAVASREFEFLATAYPRPSFNTLAGPVEVDPQSTDMFRFAGLWRVIDNPLYVFDLMSEGALLRNQANAVRFVFPSLSAYFDAAIQTAITDAKSKDEEYEVPYPADAGIRDWLGIPIVVKPYQAAYVEGSKRRENAPNPTKANLSTESKNSLSAAQSSLYAQVGR